ncbi:unnamed protein product [Rotaria sordida]|uniref:Uncharacterized protein n=1 Tax=Rotaria sordida TaxID=392033 RepID=A0A814KZ47_9BILA|nr:unnamed protein product [Rotaria sordida]
MHNTFLYYLLLSASTLSVVISDLAQFGWDQKANPQDYNGPWGEGVKCPYGNPPFPDGTTVYKGSVPPAMTTDAVNYLRDTNVKIFQALASEETDNKGHQYHRVRKKFFVRIDWKGSDQLLGQPIYSADYAIVDIQPTTIELDPGKSGMITLRFQAPCNANAALLPIFSGFINITNNVNDQVAHIPYAGVVGDYKNARILVRNSSSRIVTGILNSNNIYISNTQQENLNLSNGTRVILVTAWASRIVFVEAVSGENQVLPSLATSYGYISTQPRQAPAFYINLVRNTAISFRSYSQSYEITWLGLVSKFVSNGSSLWLETARLPNGQYKLRFSALKHFGNEKNAEDYDIYETPTFNLIGSSTTTVSSTSTPSSNATESSIATPISLNIRELLIFLNLAFLFY